MQSVTPASKSVTNSTQYFSTFKSCVVLSRKALVHCLSLYVPLNRNSQSCCVCFAPLSVVKSVSCELCLLLALVLQGWKQTAAHRPPPGTTENVLNMSRRYGHHRVIGEDALSQGFIFSFIITRCSLLWCNYPLHFFTWAYFLCIYLYSNNILDKN